jgi:transcriptional regulator with XRE-family HTH domain
MTGAPIDEQMPRFPGVATRGGVVHRGVTGGGVHPQPTGEVSASGQGLADVLDAYLATHGLTLQQMSERSGLAIATIAALRSGTRGKRPHPTTVSKLAAAMGMEIAELHQAVAAGGGPARLREAQLLARFRELADADKAAVEEFVGRLVRPHSRADIR